MILLAVIFITLGMMLLRVSSDCGSDYTLTRDHVTGYKSIDVSGSSWDTVVHYDVDDLTEIIQEGEDLERIQLPWPFSFYNISYKFELIILRSDLYHYY